MGHGLPTPSMKRARQARFGRALATNSISALANAQLELVLSELSDDAVAECRFALSCIKTLEFAPKIESLVIDEI